MSGFLQRFHAGSGLFPFHQLRRVFQKGIRFGAAQEEGWHLQPGQIAPDVEILQARAIDLRFPFRRIDQFVGAVLCFAGNPGDLVSQRLVTQVTEDAPTAISVINGFQLIEGSPALFRRLDKGM